MPFSLTNCQAWHVLLSTGWKINARYTDIQTMSNIRKMVCLLTLTWNKDCLAGHLRQLTTKVAHVLPVSDDGGSTAEIVRVLGGPAVGDIRSRCLRLADESNEEVNHFYSLFLTTALHIQAQAFLQTKKMDLSYSCEAKLYHVAIPALCIDSNVN